MATRKLLTNGNAFKRTDGRWGGTVWYMDEAGERQRKSFSGTTKQEVNKKMTAYIADFESDEEYLCVITNPPYGERLLDVKEAERLYKIMGQRFSKREHYSYTVISPDDDFEKCFGRTADKRRKLYNGMLKCNVYMYFK